MQVGEINPFHPENDNFKCMGYGFEIDETLQKVVANNELFSKFSFLPEDRQILVFDILKGKDGILYKNLDSKKRTLFLRETADNFRGSAKQPTEQSSYSILNLTEMVNSPYG